ncbi:MAG: hypothetical protein HYS08_08695 [Chlamydiae bacterium]|nr:hypothetical protein [Chlamydiota bacterium]
MIEAIFALIAKIIYKTGLSLFFKEKPILLICAFMLFVPIILQILIKKQGWRSLGFKKEKNLQAILKGVLIGTLWTIPTYFLANKFFPNALQIFKQDLLNKHFTFGIFTLGFTLFISFCGVFFSMGYVGTLMRKSIPSLPLAGLMIAILTTATGYEFLLQHPNTNGLIAFLVSDLGTMIVISYTYLLTENILTAWMCKFISYFWILFFLL